MKRNSFHGVINLEHVIYSSRCQLNQKFDYNSEKHVSNNTSISSIKKKHCIIIITWSPSLFKDSGLGSVEEVSIGSIFKPPPGPPGSHTAGVPTCKKR